jgi:hypothetical protein
MAAGSVQHAARTAGGREALERAEQGPVRRSFDHATAIKSSSEQA